MKQEELDERYSIVEKLVRLFKFERFIHLAVTGISLVILLVAISFMIYNKEAGKAELSLMFGSSGLITYTGGRLLRMWDQALKIIVTGKL
jgi:hypothetical protein